MDAARWERVQTLFHDALEQPAAERAAFVHSLASHDPELVRDVLALIEADGSAASVLDHDLADVAVAVLEPAESFPSGVGPYRLVRCVGQGGMGSVYLAERADLNSRAAIKILRDASLSPLRRDRFASERRTLAQLNHPSITRLYDADALPDGTPYLIMEYVEGEPITDYCRNRRLTIADRLRLFREVCLAVQYAHRHAIIHRDLKPSNILVKADGAPKLLDFGIAKQLESIDALPDPTRTGMRLLTPAYAAPEQMRGEPVGMHTDVYALGVILYELLTDRAPFNLSQLTPGQAETVILEHDPEKPSVVARREGGWAQSRSAWAELDVLCLTAMHKDAQRRYRTVEALIRDLDHFCNGERLEVRPDTLRYRAAKFVRRHRPAVAATVLVALLVTALIAFYTVRLARARDAALAEVARTQRIQSFMLNLLQGGDATVGPSDTLRVLTLIDRGTKEARLLDSEPDIQATLYHTLGGIYQELGNFARADSLLQAALAQRTRLLGPQHPDVVSSTVALGLLRLDQAQLEQSETLIRQGFALGRRQLPAGHPALLYASWALGKVLEERGQYDDAIGVLTEAVEQHAQGSTATPELARAMTELANTHFYAGHFPVSDSINRILLAVYREMFGERHPNVADVLINLGAIQFEGAHYVEAEKLYRPALDIIAAFYGPEHPATASAVTMLARALVYQQRFPEARALLQRALSVRERVYGAVHPSVASTVNELGSIALQTNDLAGAEASFKRNIEIYRAVYGESHYLLAVALSNLASVYLKGEEYSRAEPIFRDVIRRFSSAQSPTHLNTGIARIKLGRALTRQNQLAEAETQLLAGFEIVSKQTAPTASWLKSAREDLVIVYEGLKQPEKAARWRQE